MFDALDDMTPPLLLWRQQFPANIAGALVTANNPTGGALSISDLELTGVIAHTDVLAQDRDVRERTLWLASDNRAAVAWATKGSATSLAARSHLLRLNALHQRSHRYLARHHYIPGPVNTMADKTMPADGGTFLILPFSHTLTLGTPRRSLGECGPCRPRSMLP